MSSHSRFSRRPRPSGMLLAALSTALLLVLLLPLLASPAAAQEAARERSSVEEKYKWNLADIYPDEAAWEKDLAKLKAMVPEVTAFKGKLGESAETLLAFRKKSEEMSRVSDRLYSYAALMSDQDTRDSHAQGLKQRIASLGVEIESALSWSAPELVAIPREKLQGYLDSTPGLKIYQHYFDDLWRSQAHILSDKEERILSLAGDLSGVPGAVFSGMTNADLRFGTFKDENGQDVEMTEARYYRYLQSTNRRVRHDAFATYYEGYSHYINASAASLGGAMKRDLFYTRARGYNSCLEASMDGDNVKPEILENLIATVSRNMEPVKKYYQIQRREMGLDTLYSYDTNVPFTPQLDETIPYEKGVTIIEEGLAPLGPDYAEAIKKGFTNRWIDVYENVGKRSGAYSWNSSAVPHPYMLLNYESRFEDVSTMAHEMGHAMHSYFTAATQPQIYTDIPLFSAEVASTVNEALLTNDLLKKTNDREKRIYYLNLWCKKIMGTVYTQVMFAEFEKSVHEMAEKGEPITVESLGNLYRSLLVKYSGGEVTYPEQIAMGWSRIGHFYRNFYVYKYATSYAAATAISQRILNKEPGARDAYLTFLKSGSSDYPIEVIKRAGVDLSTPAPIQATCDLLKKLVDELDKELQAQKKG